MKERFQSAIDKSEHLQHELQIVKKDKETVEKKLNNKLAKSSGELTKAVADLKEEKALNGSLLANQTSWQQRVTHLERQVEQMKQDRDRTVSQLEDQLRDIYLHLEARSQMKDSELEGGQVVLGPSVPSSPAQGASRGAARNKKKGK